MDVKTADVEGVFRDTALQELYRPPTTKGGGIISQKMLTHTEPMSAYPGQRFESSIIIRLSK